MRLALVTTFVFAASSALARPVSFVGSTMGMAQAQPDMANISVDYTFARRASLGIQYSSLRRAAGALDFVAPEINLLLFRHNADDWQANVFVTGAAGASFEVRRPFFAALASLEIDAESRRFLALASGRLLQTASDQQDWQLLSRIGFAPVVGEANELNPWVLLQYQYMPGFEQAHTISPVVRLLYQGFLAEAGVSLRGTVFFNIAAEVP
jgi:hypothetical protein